MVIKLDLHTTACIRLLCLYVSGVAVEGTEHVDARELLVDHHRTTRTRAAAAPNLRWRRSMSSHRSLHFRLLSRSSQDSSFFALTAVRMERAHFQVKTGHPLGETNRTVLALSTNALAYAAEHKATISWEHELKTRKRTWSIFPVYDKASTKPPSCRLVLGFIAQLRLNPACVSLVQPC